MINPREDNTEEDNTVPGRAMSCSYALMQQVSKRPDSSASRTRFTAPPSFPRPTGLCTALVWANKGGWEIMGSDIFPDYVDRINKKTLHSLEPEVTEYLKDCTKLTVRVGHS